MDCKITLIPSDGIGPEIVAEAVKVLMQWLTNMDISSIIRRF